MKFHATVLFIGLTMVATQVNGQESKKNLDAFPKAKDGMARYVIHLPEKSRDEEGRFRVEIFVGKEMLTDGVNTVSLGGEILERPLKGWGFVFYEVAEFGGARSTLVGVPPGTPRKNEFVVMPSKTIAYNSRLPIVVYVPEGGEVRYRIWEAGETAKATKDE